ncbi:MAG: family 43 glycosylhydrolase [Pseudolysinimonas sp.]
MDLDRNLNVAFPAAPSVLHGFYADPNLIEFDGVYYIYPTTDGLDDWAASSFSVFSSKNLVDWHDHGTIFSVADDTTWAHGFAWAPAVSRRDGQFFLYYTADQDNVGVAVAPTPLGPFVDSGKPLVASGQFSGRAIDPSVFIDDDGSHYLLWGNTVAHGVRLNEDMVSFDPSGVTSWDLPGFREAAWMHRRGATYYLSWSQNDTRDQDYCVHYATSSSPTGPWDRQGELLSMHPDRGILGTGHHSIVRVPGTDDWLIAYHRFSIPDGDGHRREVTIDRLRHADDGRLEAVIPSTSPIHIDLFRPTTNTPETTHDNER